MAPERVNAVGYARNGFFFGHRFAALIRAVRLAISSGLNFFGTPRAILPKATAAGVFILPNATRHATPDGLVRPRLASRCRNGCSGPATRDSAGESAAAVAEHRK